MSLLILTVLLLVLYIVISIMASLVPSTVLLIWRMRRKKSESTPESESKNGKNGADSVIPNVIIEFMRSFDCGLLLATLFLHLIPFSRKCFELFFLQMSATNVKSLVLIRTDFIGNYEYRGIPFVELMICLSFFGLYFSEEFIQTCLKYRKYYWFSNENIVFCNQMSDFESLDYRLNKTRHYLITCSRKTSAVTSFANTCSTNKSSDNTNPTNPSLKIEHKEEQKDSLEIITVPYHSSQPSSLQSESSQLPSFWRANHPNGLKVYLPQLTSVNSVPVLTILEGVIISSQETIEMLLLIFGVILFHKIVIAFAISCEIYERTESKIMPISTIVSFSLLPALGFLFVVVLNNVFFVESVEKRISAMILSVISSASLLHIILISVRNNYMQFLLPHKNGIVQHFTMYSGFISILGLTALINSKR